MDKLLITGFSGFVSRHFLQFLYEERMPMEIYGVDMQEPTFDYSIYTDVLDIKFRKLNLLDISNLRCLFTEYTPDYILHLASYSSVAYSWQHPTESFINNTNIFLNLATVVKEFNCRCRILSIGSSEEYGNIREQDLPIKEDMQLKPISPYAVARVSQEMLSRVFVDSFHMNIIMTRSFNHIGPWQDSRFVIPNFVKQIVVQKKQGIIEGNINTGDVSIVRDFVDVRDVVRAYYLLLMKGTVGEVYNVCSGRGTPLKDIICLIADALGISITPIISPELIRPNDNKNIVGCNQKIREEIGWKPTILLETTIQDMISSYLKQIEEYHF